MTKFLCWENPPDAKSIPSVCGSLEIINLTLVETLCKAQTGSLTFTSKILRQRDLLYSSLYLSTFLIVVQLVGFTRQCRQLFCSSPPHPISEILACFFASSTPTIEILLLYQYCLYTCIIERDASLVFKHSIALI